MCDSQKTKTETETEKNKTKSIAFFYVRNCPNVMQFLHTILHFIVAHTMEQHPNTHGTSSSGGMEQAHTKHMK
jgi:hypothetical protein